MVRQSPNEPLRGVNLGGWLVLERWMTPRLFEGTDARDEYQFMQTPGALAKLREHQKTFIQEEDFKWLAEHSINAVRIPVGYWVLDGDEPFRACIGRLDWAVRMAEKHNLRVLICLHGAPGSQNGQDHSGRIGDAKWYKEASYRQQTVELLRRLAERYREQPAVWGLELLNEPLAWLHLVMLRRFYRDAYAAIRTVARPGLVTVFHDAFMPRLVSGTLRAQPEYPVMMDVHWYHFFTPRVLQYRTPLGWYYRVLRWRRSLLARLGKDQPVIVGEWSGVIGGEALTRYPKAEHGALQQQHLRAQLEVFSEAAGWFYWNYKTQERGIFHFRSMVEDGHVPEVSSWSESSSRSIPQDTRR